MPQAIRIQNPAALLTPELSLFLKDALTSSPLAMPGGWDSMAGTLYTYVTDARFFLIVGIESGAFQALAFGFLPGTNLYPYPTINLFFAKPKSSIAVKRAVQAKILAHILEHGYNRCLAINATGHPDEVWERAFGHKHVGMQPVGTAYVLNLE